MLNDDEKNRPLYMISVAAELLDVMARDAAR